MGGPLTWCPYQSGPDITMIELVFAIRFLWLIITPLGSPVEPDVKIISARWSGFNGI